MVKKRTVKRRKDAKEKVTEIVVTEAEGKKPVISVVVHKEEEEYVLVEIIEKFPEKVEQCSC